MSRRNKGEKIYKIAKDSIEEKMADLFLQEYAPFLEHLSEGDHVEDHVPIGKDKFIDWVKKSIESYFPEISGTLGNETIIKQYAQQIADFIAKSNTSVLNPLKDYKISKDPVFVRGNIYYKQIREATKEDTKEKTESIFGEPQEWSRVSPKTHNTLQRISDRLYQDPETGEFFTLEVGLTHQNSPGFNDENKKRKPFLGKKPSHKTKEKDTSNQYDVFKNNENLLSLKAESDLLKLFKTSQVESNFEKTTMSTRDCPDHPGQQLMRVEDEVKQCPLDGKIYNFSKGFYTEDGEPHNGGSVSSQNAIVASSDSFIKIAGVDTAGIHNFLWQILKYLPVDSKERKILEYKFSNNISLEEAITWIDKAEKYSIQEKI